MKIAKEDGPSCGHYLADRCMHDCGKDESERYLGNLAQTSIPTYVYNINRGERISGSLQRNGGILLQLQA